jgi:hypothetical protein
MKVKDTYLSAIVEGDIGMHRSKGLFAGDILGPLIVLGEGNRGRDEDLDGDYDEGYSSGDYTHCFLVSERPDPEAEVKAVSVDKKTGRVIYKVVDPKKAGLKIHSTWPCVKEEPIKWEESHMQMWRVRRLSKVYRSMDSKMNIIPQIVINMIRWARDRKGQQYDWLNLITFGLISLPNGRHCSRFVFDAVKAVSQFTDRRDDYILSPEGMHDGLPTPNDLINSRKMIRLRYRGLKSQA